MHEEGCSRILVIVKDIWLTDYPGRRAGRHDLTAVGTYRLPFGSELPQRPALHPITFSLPP